MNDPHDLLEQHPFLREWIVECRGCHVRGFRADKALPDPALIAKLDPELRKLFQPLALTPDGLCPQCRESEGTGTSEAPDDGAFVSVGSFDPPEADKVLKAFLAAEVPFEIEPNDDQIKQMDPHTASTGGTAGIGVFINIYVDPACRDRATEIVRGLFGRQH